MKLSISTNITNPIKRGDNYLEAIRNYAGLADEVVVVDGGSTDGSLKEIEKLGLGNVRVVHFKWAYHWDWKQIPLSFNFGMEQCTGDWVIKMDIDRFFKEQDFEQIRARLEERMQDQAIASFMCYNFPLYNHYFSKGWRACGINKKFMHIVKLGRATNEHLSLSHPIEVKGKDEDGIYYGHYNAGSHLHIGKPMFNYDGTFKTKKQIKYFWRRYWNAYSKYYKTRNPFNKEKDAIKIWKDYHRAEIEKAEHYKGDHPNAVCKLIADITPLQWGFDGWGLLHEIKDKKRKNE